MILTALTTVLLIGASDTEGAVSDPTGPSYAELLALDYDVTNFGFGGTRTDHWVGILETRCATIERHDVATLLIGINDTAIPTPLAVYEARLRIIAEDLIDFCADRVIVIPDRKNFSAGYVVPGWDYSIEAGYRDAALRVCADYECGPDMFELLIDPDDHNAPIDGHPNRYGHARMAGAIAETIPAPVPGLGTVAGLLTVLSILGARQLAFRTIR